jgi:hypothetical protein
MPLAAGLATAYGPVTPVHRATCDDIDGLRLPACRSLRRSRTHRLRLSRLRPRPILAVTSDLDQWIVARPVLG